MGVSPQRVTAQLQLTLAKPHFASLSSLPCPLKVKFRAHMALRIGVWIRYAPPTFHNITVNGGSELFFGPLVEVLAVYDAHLLEESGLAALSGAEQKYLH